MALPSLMTGPSTWPRMRARLADRPDDLALLQAMEDEHARIDPLIAAVDGALADHGDGHRRLGASHPLARAPSRSQSGSDGDSR
jgi:hypothetical protein